MLFKFRLIEPKVEDLGFRAIEPKVEDLGFRAIEPKVLGSRGLGFRGW